MPFPGVVQRYIESGHVAEYVGPITKNMISDLGEVQYPERTAFVSPHFDGTFPFFPTITDAMVGLGHMIDANNHGLIVVFAGNYAEDVVLSGNIDIEFKPGVILQSLNLNGCSQCYIKGDAWIQTISGTANESYIEVAYTIANLGAFTSSQFKAKNGTVYLNGDTSDSYFSIEAGLLGINEGASGYVMLNAVRCSVDMKASIDLRARIVHADEIKLNIGLIRMTARTVVHVMQTGGSFFVEGAEIYDFDNSEAVRLNNECRFVASNCWISGASYPIHIVNAQSVILDNCVLISRDNSNSVYSDIVDFPLKIYGNTVANVSAYQCTYPVNTIQVSPAVTWWR